MNGSVAFGVGVLLGTILFFSRWGEQINDWLDRMRESAAERARAGVMTLRAALGFSEERIARRIIRRLPALAARANETGSPVRLLRLDEFVVRYTLDHDADEEGEWFTPEYHEAARIVRDECARHGFKAEALIPSSRDGKLVPADDWDAALGRHRLWLYILPS